MQIHSPPVPDLLIGTDSLDDAAVWKNPDGTLSIFSIDAFTPVVDDPRLYGQIAAANAVSDIYAMGGVPKFALNIVVWPQEKLGLDLLTEVIEGGNEAAAEGGWVVVGGHTISGVEPIYGQAIIGLTEPENLLANSGGESGQALLLTKPIGTGIISTALKASAEPEEHLIKISDGAVKEMRRLNKEAAKIARSAAATAATDITGFGLAGHLHKLALASGLGAEIESSKIPLLEGVLELMEYSPGGAQKNLDFVKDFIQFESEDPNIPKLLADPQTSGGLVFSCPQENAQPAREELQNLGHRAEIIGHLSSDIAPGRLLIQ